MFALHAADGLLEPTTAAATGALALVAVAWCLRRSGQELGDRHAPLAGLAAAFIFAAQLVNFPVGVGTSGHLIGAALAAILLGPATGVVVVAVVVVVQALLFADGGITALGYNVLNMAVVPAATGWALFIVFGRMLPRTRQGMIAAGGLASALSVCCSAMAFALQWLFGASAPVAFDDVFAAMVSIHVLIGVGEGLITATVLGSVLAARPDIVRGAQVLAPAGLVTTPARMSLRVFGLGALALTLVVATVISQYAVSTPDGLEQVVDDLGLMTETVADPAQDREGAGSGLFSDYATAGISNQAVSLAIAGVVGTAVTLLVGLGLTVATRPRDTSLWPS